MPEVKGFKYTYSPGQIDKMLEKMRSTGRPDKLTIQYAQNTWLLKDAQYSAVIDLLKAMQFLTSDGRPTDLYAQYQNKSLSRKAIGIGAKNAFPAFFKAFPQASSLSKEDLEGYIVQQTGSDASIVTKIYATIKKLIALGDFSEENAEADTSPNNGTGARENGIVTNKGGIPITMNIQIVLPNDATPETYDSIFTSIKKNLLGS